ncbi:ArnT family glycosyltransferase [Vibrio aphrogenes]|uniref:ArnT family glycosyltransferase n=1 Tax=Vibrio aphrogenes TaxID=1891186 RepID=UPI000B35BD99|nr:glycosyltransferase family 39 protein [Vibrio aphrogenes]
MSLLNLRSKKTEQHQDYYSTLFFLLIVATLIIFTGIGWRDPWPADEPRFVEVAREMVQSGQWFFPMRGGELYPDKPPVFMWSMAALYWLTGDLKATFLLPNAIVSLLVLLCCYDISAKLWNVKTARTVGLLLLITPQFIIQAKAAQIDAMVAAWITLAMYGLLRHFFLKSHWLWYCLAWAFMGLGIITKGVGFLPALLLIPVLYLHFSGQHRFENQISWKLLLGPLIMLLVVACWLLPMLMLAESSHNPDFIAYKDNILFKQTGERYANAWGHIQPWWYFLTNVIPMMWFPLYFVWLNRPFWQQLKRSPVILSLLIWVVLLVIFFSISPGKRGVYVLPAVPMMAIIAGWYLSHYSWQRWTDKLLKIASIVIAGLLLIATVMAGSNAPILTKQLGDNLLPYAAFFAGVACLWIIIYWQTRRQSGLITWGSAISLTWVLYSLIGYSLLNPIRTPAKAIMQQVAQDIGLNGELGVTRFKEQFLLFSPISLTHFSYLADKQEQDRNAWLWLKEQPNRYIFTEKTEDMVCFDVNKAKPLGQAHRRKWILLDASAMLSHCQAPQTIKRYHLSISQPYSE